MVVGGKPGNDRAVDKRAVDKGLPGHGLRTGAAAVHGAPQRR